ncbi:MAG: hypothetical protein ABIH52_02855, partial [Candidatus Aenigmatarchaeota archaeon]
WYCSVTETGGVWSTFQEFCSGTGFFGEPGEIILEAEGPIDAPDGADGCCGDDPLQLPEFGTCGGGFSGDACNDANVFGECDGLSDCCDWVEVPSEEYECWPARHSCLGLSPSECGQCGGCNWLEYEGICGGSVALQTCTLLTLEGRDSCEARSGCCEWREVPSTEFRCMPKPVECDDLPTNACIECGCHLSGAQYFIQGDFGYITNDQSYICINDSDGSNNIDLTAGKWNWWDGSVHHYVIHDIPGLTQAVSNGLGWFYCDATGTLEINPDAPDITERGDNEVVPSGTSPTDHDQRGVSQFWPDADCDGYANCDGNEDGVPGPEDDVFGWKWPKCSSAKHHACEWNPTTEAYYGADCVGTDLYPITEPCDSSGSDPGDPGGSDGGRVSFDDFSYKRGGIPPPEDTEELCSDEIDNDFDDKIDCVDPDCLAADLDICTPEPDVEICDDGEDNDGNGLEDCDDPACVGYSGGGTGCVPSLMFDSFVAAGNSFLCYKDEGKNYFGECYVPFSTRTHPNLESYYNFASINTFYYGSSTHVLTNFNAYADGVLENYIQIFAGSESKRYVFEDFSGYDSFSFDIMYNTPVTIKFTNDAGQTQNIQIGDYSINGDSIDVFHHVIIPIDHIFPESSQVINEIEFQSAPGFLIYADNLIFHTLGTADDSQNRICGGRGGWITDLDPSAYNEDDFTTYQAEMYACNKIVPLGYGGIGWTGTKCCGDDSTKASPEYYTDKDAGCFMGSVIPNGNNVSFILNNEDFEHLLFSNDRFWSCRKPATEYDIYHPGDGSNGQDLIPDDSVVEICARKGDKVCSHDDKWELISEYEEHDFDYQGQLAYCKEGVLYFKSAVYDWVNQYAKACSEPTCYCRSNLSTDCPAEADNCVLDETVADGHICLDGNWTTRTALMAGYLYDFAKNKNDYVLSCNVDDKTLYEGETWNGPELTDSVCVLKIPGNTEASQVIIGAALKDGVNLGTIAGFYRAEGDNKPNIPADIDLSNCLGAPVLCYSKHESAEDDINRYDIDIYYMPDEHFFFVSNKDDNFEDVLDSGVKKTFWKRLFSIFDNIESWFGGSTARDLDLSTNMNKLYINEFAAGSTIYAFQETSYDPDSREPNPANRVKEMLSVTFYGVGSSGYDYLSKNFKVADIEYDDDTIQLISKDVTGSEISKLQKLRLYAPPGGGASPIFAKT